MKKDQFLKIVKESVKETLNEQATGGVGHRYIVLQACSPYTCIDGGTFQDLCNTANPFPTNISPLPSNQIVLGGPNANSFSYTCNGSNCTSNDINQPFQFMYSTTISSTYNSYNYNYNVQGGINWAFNILTLVQVSNSDPQIPGSPSNPPSGQNVTNMTNPPPGNVCGNLIGGCTDPLANNFNPNAVYDDGSCGAPLILDSHDSLTIEICDIGGNSQLTIGQVVQLNAVLQNYHTCNGIMCTIADTQSPNNEFEMPAGTGIAGAIFRLLSLGTEVDSNYQSQQGGSGIDVFSSNCPPAIQGCMDPLACNYNSQAQVDNGSCILPDGCTNANACNYDSNALCDDGSCILPDGCTDSTACNYDSNALCDDGSCSGYYGCTDSTACNYDPLAGCDDGSCSGYYGCTDSTMCNYDASAGCDDGSCSGYYDCTDSTACNYDPIAGCDDGSCEYPGCANPLANGNPSYNPNAGCPDNSCEFVYCLDPSMANYICDVYGLFLCAGGTTWDTSLGTFTPCSNCCTAVPIPGCINTLACNFDPLATVDDGTCEIPGTCEICISGNPVPQPDPSCWGCDDQNVQGPITGIGGSCSNCNVYDPLVQFNDGSCCTLGCTDQSAQNFDTNACIDDGSCIPHVLGCMDSNVQGTIAPNTPVTCTTCNIYDPFVTLDDGSCCIMGCTDGPLGGNATNYNANACIDDGSCNYLPPVPGCTDSNADNFDPLANQDNGTCEYEGCTNPIATNYSFPNSIPQVTATNDPYDGDPSTGNGGFAIDDGSCNYVYGCVDPTPITGQQLPQLSTQTCGKYNTPLVPGTLPNPPYVYSAANTTVWWNTPQNGCADLSGIPNPNITDCCMYYGCQDPNALNYLPTDPNGNPTVGCPVPSQGMGVYQGDPSNTCCCQYSPLSKCTCCKGTQGGSASPTPVYINQLPNGCADFNGTNGTLGNPGNLHGCEEANVFNPKDCLDCATYDFANDPNISIVDAYNIGLQNNQTYGILDGNSRFCNEVCQNANPSVLIPTWPCKCCGDIHGCDDPNIFPKPYGCWVCDEFQGSTCSQPGTSWMLANPNANYYNDQTNCMAMASTNCPPIPSCANDPDFCSTNPYLTPGGPCWICHMGTECMPIYDYLQYGSGPPNSVGTESFMMGWLNETNGVYTTPQGSDLYCTEQDCMSATGCSAYSCAPPASGCPQGQTFVPFPTCQCQTPSKAEPKDDDGILPIDNDEIEATKIQEGVKIKGKLLDKLRMSRLANIKKK